MNKEDFDKYKKKLSSKLWRLNNLYHIIDKSGVDRIFQFNDEQYQIWKQCFKNDVLIINPNILKARQLGISTFFILNYFDDCIFNKNLNVYIQSHEQKSIEKLFRIVKYAYEKLPQDCRPSLDRGGGSKFEYFFPELNSRISVGLENRSSTIHRLHLSETAFQDLQRVSATLGALPPSVHYSSETTPNGQNWYYEDYIKASVSKINIFFPWYNHKAYVVMSDNDTYSQSELEYMDKIKKIANHCLNRQQMAFRRQKIEDLKSEIEFNKEYPSDDISCFFTADSSRLVIPEASQNFNWIGEVERPSFLDFYVGYDFGLVDYMGAVFGYLDFKNSQLIIEDELFLNYETTENIVRLAKEKEKALGMTEFYSETPIQKRERLLQQKELPPMIHKRIGDCSAKQQLYDMSNSFHYHVSPILKRSKQPHQTWKDSVINGLRIAIQNTKIIIHPRCTNLINQVKFGTWNEHRTDFERSSTFGHLDLLIALAYLLDNIDWNKNPYPVLYAKQYDENLFLGPKIVSRETQGSLKKMFGKRGVGSL